MSVQNISSATSLSHAGKPIPQNASNSEQKAARYHVIIAKPPGQDVILRVFDRARGCIFLDWQGVVVRHLFQSGALPTELSQTGYYACDKSFVWHLILAGTATQMALDQIGHVQSNLNSVLRKQLSCSAATPIGNCQRKNHLSTSESLPDRHARLGVRLAGLHKLIARMLFAHPGQHLSAEDVRCLLLVEFPSLALSDHQISTCLADLARWRVIQRIEVDAENVFFDIDTTPHLHVFDPRTRELRDANAQGIVYANHESSIKARVQHVEGSRVVISERGRDCRA